MAIFKKWQQSARKLTHRMVREDRTIEQEDTKTKESHSFLFDFYKCLNELEEKIHSLDEPKEIGMAALTAACEFYDADWCGVVDLDLKMEFLMPFWWYNRITGGMTKTIIDETGISGILPQWMDALENDYPFIVEDVEAIQEDRPKEYALFQRLETKAMLAVPYRKREKGFIILKNPKRYINRIELLKTLSYVLVSEINEQKLLDRIKMSKLTQPIDCDTDLVIHLFDGLEIATAKGKLTEEEMKSPMCCKLVVLLLLNQHRGMTARELSENLWPDSDSDNPTGKLRVLLYRLRNAFRLISDQDLIITTTNGYRINPLLNICTDYQEFESTCEAAKQVKGHSQKKELLEKAVNLYKGNLFPTGSAEHWQMAFNSKYHLQYLLVANQLLELLYKERDYESVHDYASLMLSVEPNNPKFIYWLIHILRKHGAMEMAKSQLEYAKSRLLTEEYLELEERLVAV